MKPNNSAKPAASEQARKLQELAASKGVVENDDGFRPGEIAEKLGLWRLNQAGGCFFIPGQGDTWNAINGLELRRELRANGVSCAKPEDGSLSRAERVMLDLQRSRNVHYSAQAIAGYKSGIHFIQGRRVLVREGMTLPSPEAGEFPTIHAMIEGILDAPGNEPGSPYLLGWLKVAYQTLRTQSKRTGQVLYLIGPKGCGKSRIQHHIITPLLGGRSADPLQYLAGRTDFNAELVGSEHLLVEDPDVSGEFNERDKFGKRLKQLAANDSHSLHAKGKDGMTVFPFWRVSVSQNDEQSAIDMIPPLEIFADKLIMLRCWHPDPEQFKLPATDVERQEFRERISAELPAFAAWLTAWQIPPELTSDRYGVASKVDGWVRNEVQAHSREMSLLECIDVELFKEEHPMVDDDSAWLDENTWKGNATELSAWLTREASSCRNQARGLFKTVTVLGKMLKSLSDTHPERVKIAPRTSATRGFEISRALRH